MNGERRRQALGLLGTLVAAAVLHGCSTEKPANLNLRVKDQDVPVIIAVGPMDVSAVKYKDDPVAPELERTIQHMFVDPLTRAGIFTQVIVLKLEPSAGGRPDSEEILARARDQKADLLIMGQVTDFEAKVGLPLPKSSYDVRMNFLANLYNVHSRKQVWRKTDTVQVERSEWPTGSKLKQIVETIVVPSIMAATVSPMVKHVQTAYANSAGDLHAAAANGPSASMFGGAELAKIDAELLAPVTNARPMDHAYAVVVGVETYRDLPMVDYATRDADSIKDYLIRSMGYLEQNVVVLKNDRVTRSQLEARFERWLPTQVKNYTDSEVFVYYAGHGAPDPNTNQSFLVPYDGDPAFLETTGYPVNRLYKMLNELPAKRVTVALDTCFSGAGGRSVIAKGTRPMLITVESPIVNSKHMVVFTATGANQISSAYREKRHGLFTYYFLKGLQGEADGNQDGMVDVQELDAFVRSGVQTIARRLNVEQTPQLLPSTEILGDRAKDAMLRLH